MLLEKTDFSRVATISQELAPSARAGRFEHARRRRVAEDEMGLAVAQVEMAGADLRIDAEDRAGMAARDHVGGGLDGEGRGRAAAIMSKPKPAMPSASWISMAIWG
jgi:hypothetical protein